MALRGAGGRAAVYGAGTEESDISTLRAFWRALNNSVDWNALRLRIAAEGRPGRQRQKTLTAQMKIAALKMSSFNDSWLSSAAFHQINPQLEVKGAKSLLLPESTSEVKIRKHRNLPQQLTFFNARSTISGDGGDRAT